MVCDWDGPSVLPFTSRMQQGRKRPPQSRERPTILGSKGPKDGAGDGGAGLEGNSETGGHGEGTSLAGGTKKRLCGRGRDPVLLVVPMEPGAELHEGREGISPGGWQGHLGLQHPFQQCQHLLFLHLPGSTQRVILGPALTPLTCPSSVYPQRRTHLQGLGFLTGPLQQEVSVFPDAPGCHLHQWLLWGMRNMLRNSVWVPSSLPDPVTSL